MKKVVFSIFVIGMVLISLTQITYASDQDFVSQAFDATKGFLNEKVEDKDGRVKDIFEFLKNLIKAINQILIIVLAGLSMIALSVVGIKYIMAGANAGTKAQVKDELKTVIIGMAFGFGAYAIWMIGMSIVNVIIGALSK